jgi:cyanophycin synthetase
MPLSLGYHIRRKMKRSTRLLSLVRRAREKIERRRHVHENEILWKFERHVTEHLWTMEAGAAGLRVSPIGPIMEISDGEALLPVKTHLIGLESQLASFVCRSKELTRKYCAASGVRIPEGRGFRADDQPAAIDYALGLGRPVVTKPARSDWGRGVSVNLRTEKEIRSGVRDAAMWHAGILIEEFVTGEHYRLLFFRGRLLSAVRRELASVTGDGSATVRALIERENTTRVRDYRWEPGQRLLMPIAVHKSTRAELVRAGLSLDSVPAPGRLVRLSSVSNYQFGSSYTEVADQVHPDTIATLERCCTRIGAQLAGVDVISPEISSSRYAVNEINTTPLLLLHYAAQPHRRPILDILNEFFGR